MRTNTVDENEATVFARTFSINRFSIRLVTLQLGLNEDGFKSAEGKICTLCTDVCHC